MKKVFLMLSISGTVLFATAQDKTAPAKAATPAVTVTPAQEATPAPDPNAPEFKWENTTVDYGTVTKSDEGAAAREFKFTNTGKSPLIISGCKGSCGCTVPTCPTEPILPGAKGSIKVHYDVNRVGPFTKTVTVTSNAKNPNETLKITGTVNDPEAGKTPVPVAAPSTVAPTNPH
jgi:hypothetical protein